MKKIILSSVFLISLCQSGFANTSIANHEASVIQTKNILLQALMLSPGFTGIDITGCDPLTGRQSLDEGHELCIRILFRSDEIAAAARIIYPEGLQMNGTYIIISVGQHQ